MMNKIRSAKVHLFKFLFILPLLAIVLIAFRNKLDRKSIDNIFWFAGLTLDAKTGEPLRGVAIHEKTSGIKTISDEKGFFKIDIPATNQGTKISASFSLSGYIINPVYTKTLPGDKPAANIDFIYMRNIHDPESAQFRYGSHSESYKGEPDYAAVLKRFNTYKESIIQQKRVDEIVGDSKKPIWIIEGIPYAIGSGSKAWFDKDEVNDSPEFRVWVDGHIMTMEEANKTIDRFKVYGVGASGKSNSLSMYGINYNLLMLNLIRKEGDWTKMDTIPTTDDVKRDSLVSEFLKRNTDIKNVGWVYDNVINNKIVKIHIIKKSGANEVYNVNDKSETSEFEKKYGIYDDLLKLNLIRKEGDWTKRDASPGESNVKHKLIDASLNGPSNPKIRIHGKEEPLIIVDGIQWPEELGVNIMDAKKIESINIWKSESAIDKYGEKGKNGVVTITTKKQANDNPKTGAIRIRGEAVNVVYYVNGKETSKEAIELIDPAKIQSIDVLKGDRAKEKYGEKGKNGVIEITIPVSSTINFIKRPITPAWDIKSVLPGMKKDEC